MYVSVKKGVLRVRVRFKLSLGSDIFGLCMGLGSGLDVGKVKGSVSVVRVRVRVWLQIGFGLE